MNTLLKYILIISIIFCSYSLGYEQFGENEQNIYGYEFNSNDSIKFLKKANYNIHQWELATDKDKKNYYLQEAMRYYYLLSKSDKGKIEAYIGLGRIYDVMNLDRYAKQNFSIAYNINNKNPELNYRFGDYYFKRRQLQRAQFYYNRAYNYGLSNNQDLRRKMSSMYNMLADNDLAKKYAPITNTFEAKTLISKNSNKEISSKSSKNRNINTFVKQNAKQSYTSDYAKELEHAKKILLLDDAKSDFSQYYLFIK